MSETPLTCPGCNSSRIVNNGLLHNGSQNFKCKDCTRQFIHNPTKKVIGQETRELIDNLLLEKLPLAGITMNLAYLELLFTLYPYLFGTTLYHKGSQHHSSHINDGTRLKLDQI